jgi:hypothetical protein
MNNDLPLRGADPVGGELEVGFNRSFEKRWYHAELVGRLVMLLVVAAGLAGLLGRGPWSHHSATTADRALRADFEPMARYGTTTQVTLRLPAPPPGAAEDEITVQLPSSVVEPMGLQTVLPQPSRQQARPEGLALTFAVAAGAENTLVRLMLKPETVGPVQLTARVGGRVLSWTQVVLP